MAGSLMPNRPGTKDALETAWMRLDLLLRPIREKGMVLPAPPMMPLPSIRNTGKNCKGWPAAANAEFVV